MSDDTPTTDAPTPAPADAEVQPADDAPGNDPAAPVVEAAASAPEVSEPVTVEAAAPEEPHAVPAEPVALPAPEEHSALPAHEGAVAAEPGLEPEVSVESVSAVEPPAAGEVPAESQPESVPEIDKSTRAAKPRKAKAGEPVVADASAEPEPTPSAGPADDGEAAPAPAEPVPEPKKKWYVVKIQSGREESIKAAIERKVKIEGLEEYYGQIAIPVEEFVEKKKVRVTDKKTGEKVTQEKNVTKHRKKYPGYLFAEVEFNEQILYLFRETSGVGDFVGATGPMKPPPPMSDREVTQMLTGIVDPKDRGRKPGKTVVKLDFEKGDKVRIRDGAFANMEGEVTIITEPKDAAETPKVTVAVSIFGRPVPVELDYWQVDKV